MVIDEEVYLEHFGVKGMQWGVRKARIKSTAKRAWSNDAIRRTIKIGAGATAGMIALAGLSAIANLASSDVEPVETVESIKGYRSPGETSEHFLERSSEEAMDKYSDNPNANRYGGPGSHVVTEEDLELGREYVKDHSDQFKGSWVGPPPDTSDVQERSFGGSESASTEKNIEEYEQWKKDVATGIYKRRR